jgi:hypothetical protein
MPFASRFWPSWRRKGATDENVAITYSSIRRTKRKIQTISSGCMTELLAIERVLSCSPRVPTMRTDVPVPQDTFFGPEATWVMGVAFDKVCCSLHASSQPNIVKEVIAKRIIDLAREGESDPEQLCDMTLKSLGFGAGCNCAK